MADKTIYDFLNEAAIKLNDEIPFWKVLPDGSGTSSRVSFAEFIAALPGTQLEAPVPVIATSASTPLTLHNRYFYIITLGANTEITGVADLLGKRFTPNTALDTVFISSEQRYVTFTSEFNFPTRLPVSGKVGIRFKSISDTEVVPFSIGAGGAGSNKLKSNITVAGTTWGGWKSGDTLVAGLDYDDILLRALRVPSPPKYVAPEAKLVVTGGTAAVEAGTPLDLLLTANFTKNDAGNPTGAIFYKNGVALNGGSPDTTAPFQYDESLYTIGDEEIDYNAIINYGVGPIKNDSTTGLPDPTGQIAAGSVSTDIITFAGQRKALWGFDKNTLDSANIRALQHSYLNAEKGYTFTINIPTNTQKVHFAYDAALGDVAHVLFKEGLMADIKGVFTRTTVAVQGANGFAAKNYFVYTFQPVTPYESNYTYIVTI